MTLSEYLKKLRVDRGLQQKDLAKSLQLDPSYISGLENGTRSSVGDNMVRRLQQALSLSEEEVRQLNEYRRLGSYKLSLSPHTTQEELEMLQALALAAPYLPRASVAAIRQHAESWMILRGIRLDEPTAAQKKEKDM